MALAAAMQGGAVMFRPEYLLWSDQQPHQYQQQQLHGAEYRERRQLFLRSYPFSRKQSPRERASRTFVRARRLVCVRLRAARRLPRLLWTGLRCLFSGHRRHRRRYFRRLVFSQQRRRSFGGGSSSSSSGAGDWCSW